MKNVRLITTVSLSALAIVSATVSVSAHAQSPGVTRAQANAELAQLQAAGYIGEKVTYPNRLQATQARIQAMSATQSNNATGSYGGYSGYAPRSAPQ